MQTTPFRHLHLLYTLLFLILSPYAVWAHHGSIAVAYPSSPIVVDGDLSDWPSEVRAYELSHFGYGDAPQDSADLQAVFRVAYDSEAVYVAVVVSDDSRIVEGAADGPWDSTDGCELYIDVLHDPMGSDVRQYNLRGHGHETLSTDNRLPVLWEDIEVAVQPSADGHQYEWRLPLDVISRGARTVGSGISVGFDIAIVDRDADGSVTWFPWGSSGRKILSSSRLGDLLLVDAQKQMGALHGRTAWKNEQIPGYPNRVHLVADGQPEMWAMAQVDSTGRFSVAVPVGSWDLTPVDSQMEPTPIPARDVRVLARGDVDVGSLLARGKAIRRHPQYGPNLPEQTYISHAYEEHQHDIGEVTINYAVTGSPRNPAIVLIPAQSESWWGYEKAMALLSEHFQVYAIDLRGQGRSSRTPGRYTFDNMGNDVVRFITFVVQRPTIVSGNSSGGVVSAWVSAYAPPGMIRGACYEDPPLFSSELTPAIGGNLRQTHTIWEFFTLMNRFLGDQWLVGDWEGFANAVNWGLTEPPQNIKEYDPEWARAFLDGSVNAGCDHARMLSQVRCPVLLTDHGPELELTIIDGLQANMGAMTGLQAQGIREFVTAAGQPITYKLLPEMGHMMHSQDPEFFVSLITEWAATLPTEEEVRKQGVFSER
jgi:pimeloyl-ACP methyl ester carboxylesterase